MIARLEREIAAAESKKTEIAKQREEYSSDYTKLMELDSAEAELDTELDALYSRWEELLEEQ